MTNRKNIARARLIRLRYWPGVGSVRSDPVMPCPGLVVGPCFQESLDCERSSPRFQRRRPRESVARCCRVMIARRQLRLRGRQYRPPCQVRLIPQTHTSAAHRACEGPIKRRTGTSSWGATTATV